MKKKTTAKLLKVLILLAIFLTFTSCEKNEIEDIENSKMSSENISKSQLLNELKNNQIIEFVSNNEYFSNSNDLLKNNQTTFTNSDSSIFEKIVKPNEYITYSLRLNSYTSQTPYFRFFVINKEISGIEKAGFVKYIPSTPTYQLDVDNFYGDIEIYTVENELFAKTTFQNGQPVNNNVNKVGNNTTLGCMNAFYIIAHPCSHGGGHMPGESCENGLVNDAYYEIRTTVICVDTVKSIVPPDNFGGTGGGGGGSTILNLLNIPPVYEGEPSFNNQSYMFFQQVYNFLQANQTYTNLINHNYANANLLNEWLVPSIVDYFRNNGFTQENQINVINAMNMFATFLPFESNQYNFEEMLVNKHEVFKLLMQNSQWLSSQTNQTKQDIFNFLLQNHLEEESRGFAEELINLANNEEDTNLITNLINLSIITKQFEHSLNSNYYNLINPYTEVDTQIYNPLWYTYFTTQCAIARHKLSQQPGWNNLYDWQKDAKVYWEASKEMLHLGLDLIGLVPVVGEVADLANGIIYTIEGDGVNATLSFASTIPIAGWFSAGVKFAKRADGLNYLVKGTNNLISFGAPNSTKFRALCGIAVGDATKQAHHLIPRGSQIIEHEVVQRAAKATTNQGFHIDQALNGIAVATWRNQPNHNTYNNKIYTKLQSYIQLNPNATPNQCYNQLMTILNQAKQAVINNPNVHLNNLNF